MLKKNLLIYAFLAIIVSFIVYLTFNLDQVGYFSLKNNQRITNYYHNQIYLALFTSAAFVLFGYLSLGSLLIINSRPVNFIYTKKQDIVIRTFIIISAVICIITLWFAPETSFTNLIKNIFEKSIPNRIDNLELRLSMQNLPTALQFIFELERRIITPFLLIEIFCRPSQVNISRWYKILLLIIASFNILYTIDRSIGALYVFVVLATHLHQNGIKFLMEKKFYFLLSLLFTCVVVLKHFQYGEFWSHEKMKNLHWTNNYTETGNIKIPALNNYLVASEKIETKNNPLLPENFENNSHSETRSSKTFKKEKLKISFLSANDSLVNYFHFAYSSLEERVFLSPLQMLSYSFHEFNEKTFLHFKYVRILSFVGLSNYVKPSENSGEKYNKSFPLGYLGDLWRNGGWYCIFGYSFMLGIILVIIDRCTCSEIFIASKILALAGIISLFYSNALSASSLSLLIPGFLLSLPNISTKK